MKNLYTLLFICLCSPALLANIDYEIRVDGNDLVVSIVSEKSYDQPENLFITGEFTIAWSELYGENIIEGIEVLSDIPFDFDPNGTPMSQLQASKYYQKFGFANPVVLDLQVGQAMDVLRINLLNTNQASAVLAANVSIDKNPPVKGGQASFINVFAEQWKELDQSSNGAVGINDARNASISLFPNPATDRLFVQLAEDANTLSEISITDINGRVVFNQKIQQSSIDLNIASFPVGTYYLQVHTGSEFLSGQKFVKID